MLFSAQAVWAHQHTYIQETEIRSGYGAMLGHLCFTSLLRPSWEVWLCLGRRLRLIWRLCMRVRGELSLRDRQGVCKGCSCLWGGQLQPCTESKGDHDWHSRSCYRMRKGQLSLLVCLGICAQVLLQITQEPCKRWHVADLRSLSASIAQSSTQLLHCWPWKDVFPILKHVKLLVKSASDRVQCYLAGGLPRMAMHGPVATAFGSGDNASPCQQVGMSE